MNTFRPLCFLLFISCVYGCQPEQKTALSGSYNNIALQYATGFTIEKHSTYTLVSVLSPYKGATKSLKYVLYPRGSKPLTVEADAHIAIPISTIVCTSTTHIPLLDYLNVGDRLVGFPTTDYICSEKMRKRLDEGKVVELGIDNALNIEKLIELSPELVMTYTMNGDYASLSRIRESSIPVVINADYMEEHPLGRAEWIKFTGLLFDKEKEADSIFTSIAMAYNTVARTVSDVTDRPTVITGIVYGDSWYLPGGKNYASILLKDAGYNYHWANDSTSGSLPLSFETVFDTAHDASFWIGVGTYATLEALQQDDPSYASFSAFQNHRVYSYNKRMDPKGGSEFLELGYLRPDIILADLVSIAYPELLPDHVQFFYFQLP